MPDSNSMAFEPFIQTFRAFTEMQRDGASLEAYIQPLAETLDGLRAERELIGSAAEIEKKIAKAEERERQAKAAVANAEIAAAALLAKAREDAAVIVEKANGIMAKATEDLEAKRAAMQAAADNVRVTKEERAAFEGDKRQLEADKRRVAMESEAAAKMKADYEAKLARFSELAGKG